MSVVLGCHDGEREGSGGVGWGGVQYALTVLITINKTWRQLCVHYLLTDRSTVYHHNFRQHKDAFRITKGQSI